MGGGENERRFICKLTQQPEVATDLDTTRWVEVPVPQAARTTKETTEGRRKPPDGKGVGPRAKRTVDFLCPGRQDAADGMLLGRPPPAEHRLAKGVKAFVFWCGAGALREPFSFMKQEVLKRAKPRRVVARLEFTQCPLNEVGDHDLAWLRTK